jgi:hypothetical protein
MTILPHQITAQIKDDRHGQIMIIFDQIIIWQDDAAISLAYP